MIVFAAEEHGRGTCLSAAAAEAGLVFVQRWMMIRRQQGGKSMTENVFVSVVALKTEQTDDAQTALLASFPHTRRHHPYAVTHQQVTLPLVPPERSDQSTLDALPGPLLVLPRQR